MDDVKESGTSCKTNYCMDCKQRDLGIVGEETQQYSEHKMHAFLKKHAVNVPPSATYAQVLRLFQTYDKDKHELFTDDIKSISTHFFPHQH